MKNIKQFLIITAFFGIWSCAEKETVSNTATFLVTTNVRGQLDPCG